MERPPCDDTPSRLMLFLSTDVLQYNDYNNNNNNNLQEKHCREDEEKSGQGNLASGHHPLFVRQQKE